ncbi:MAG: hypothetical protein AUI36_07160, partial [Cyanobacteria bacterium 13_1_40CM_2_61_4]
PRSLPEEFLNPELSWLHFNTRVLALAEDSELPLLARVRFLSIVSSNLDEFVMVRVGGLKNAAAAGSRQASDDGLTPEEQLDAISIRMRPLLERQARCLADVLLPELAARGIRILRWPELDEPQRRSLRRHFVEQIFPVLTPQAITRAPGHPFPLVANLRLSLAALVRDPRSGPDHFAYFKLPESLPRFVPLSESREFVPLEDVVRANLDVLYPGREVRAAHCFRVTRSGDLALEEESAASLLLAIEEQAKRRPYGAAVRLEVERAMPQAMRDLLLRELQFEEAGGRTMLGPGDLYEVEGLLDPAALREIADLPSPELQYPSFRGRAPLPSGGSIFSVIAEGDVLVHHPYDAFDATVERFISEAADDPDTVAIKLTLYRAGGRSGIVDALVRAAQAGKEVFVFVEVKARFDEERNIDWAKKLEDARIRVVYGLVRLKMHAKAALVVRREGDVVRRYLHVGTGNYNAATAAVYTDLGLLTADEALGADVHDLFNELSGSSRPPGSSYRRLLVGPTQLLPRFIALIDREAQHARAGRGGRVRAKLNGLADAEIVSALYRASQAGVAVDLVVRGICTLRPGVVGLSERIRVTSAVGRFLEHARIYHFAARATCAAGSRWWPPCATPAAGPGWTRSSRLSSTTRRRGSWTPTDRTAAAIRAVPRRSVSRARSSNSWSALARPEARPRGRAVRARGARAGSELRRAALPLDGEGRHRARRAGAGPDHYHSHPDGLGAARSHRAGPLRGSRRPRTHGLWRRRLGAPRRQAQGRPRLAHRADGAAGQSSRLVHRGRDPVAPLWGGVRASARVAGLARRQARDRQERPRRPAAPCPGVRAGVLRRRAPAWREAADSRAARPLQFLDSRPVGDSSRLSRDRARAMTAPTRVYCRAMGPVRVSVNGADAPPELLWRKHLALLVYLARSPRRSRTREHLVGLLWSDR